MSYTPHVWATVFDAVVAPDPVHPSQKIVMYTLHCTCLAANKQLLWWNVSRRCVGVTCTDSECCCCSCCLPHAFRFSDFVNFNEKLKGGWPSQVCPLPSLPAKHLKLFGLDTSRALRNSRVKHLSTYLEDICKRENAYCF